MSKVLKLIVHLVVIGTIICVLGLALPPFFGVTTVIMDDSGNATNLPMGSVTYAIPQKAAETAVGTPILVQEDGKTYRYNISTLNLENGTGTVVDPTVSSGETITVAVKEYVPKVVVTIGLIGYLLVATKSMEGMIVIGLAVLFLIILYVIAELWRKDPEDEEEIEDTAPGYVKTKKELKREERIKARQMRDEEEQIRLEARQKKKEEKIRKKMIRTGGFVDEIEDEEAEAAEEPEAPVVMQNAASEAHELLKKEIAAATAEEVSGEPEAQETETPQVTQETRDLKEEMQESAVSVPEAEDDMEEDEQPDEVKEIGRLAIPVLSAAQLADRAKKAGDAPDIVRDDITRVTLFDYSDIIGAEAAQDEE